MADPSEAAANQLHFIQAGGEMGALMRALDWSQTSLGPLSSWPQSLRTSVSTMLRSPYPIILFWGPERRMLYNDPFRPILGAKHPATMGARGSEALAEEWALLGPLMDRAYSTGDPIFVENGNVNFQRRPGGLREEAYFTWSYNPTIGERGEIAGLFAIASETTRQVIGERRVAVLRELSLRTALDKKSEDVFRSLDASLAQAGYDTPFALLYVVEAERARLVSCSGLVAGSSHAPRELKPEDASPWPIFAVAHTQEEQLLESLDGPLPGGPWLESSTRALALPVLMGSEQLRGVLVAGLSPLGALDAEYRSFLQLLARQLSASITSARAYEGERRRAEQLAALDEAKTAFFSNVSHELRTPLTLILSPVEDALSSEKPLSGETLSIVRRNALRLLKMVNTLLDFSRMESGRAQALFVPTDLPALTRDLASQFRSAVEHSGLSLTIDCQPLPEPIFVDPEMWEKIVLNLLSNAVKYTLQGGIRVALHWRDSRAELTVEDTGIGIPEAELPRVFERFYRAQATQGRSHEGTGIGLALVQELTNLHGGRVAVTSSLGAGSCFTVTLPSGSNHLPSATVPAAISSPATTSNAAPFVEEALRWSTRDEEVMHRAPVPRANDSERSEARILVVDDNADLRAYVADLLSRSFSHVTTARDGVEGLQRVREQRPDLVLSDVMMPNLDGLGLVRALREDEQTRAIPIILLSARAGDDPTLDGLAVGADDYLVKPFSARELLARVRAQLSMASIRHDVAQKIRSEEELRREVSARDAWLSLVSHELRTPLSAAALSVQALIDVVPEQERPRIQSVERSIARLHRQVDYLTDVAELLNQRLILSLAPFDLSELLLDEVRQAREQAARVRCPLRATIQQGVHGHCDADRMRQVVRHLLDNAFKFAAGTAVTCELTATSEAISIRVADDGPGVPAAARARVFERFQRAAPHDSHPGFGLGLWVARQLVGAHGGSIGLSANDGRGALVSVSLPMRPDLATSVR